MRAVTVSRSLLLVLTCALALAACGGDGEGDATSTAPAAAVERPALVQDAAFTAAMKELTGLTLDADASEDRTILTVKPDAADAAGKTYGFFSLTVMHDVEAAKKVFLADDRGKPLTVDADGLAFRPDADGVNSVLRVVEPNVLVRWQGTTERTTDETFDALVGDVERAVTRALG